LATGTRCRGWVWIRGRRVPAGPTRWTRGPGGRTRRLLNNSHCCPSSGSLLPHTILL